MTIREYLTSEGPAKAAEIARQLGRDQRSVQSELSALRRKGHVRVSLGVWCIARPDRVPRRRGPREYRLPTDVRTVGDVVRARRDLLRWTRDRVAEAAGVPRKAVTDLERGDGSLATALAIWTALGLDLRPVESTEVPTEDRPAVRSWLVARLAEV